MTKRIIFGVQGEHMGHVTRSYTLLKHLTKRNKVKIFCGGKAYEILSAKFKDVVHIDKQFMVYKNNKVMVFQTVIANLKNIPRYVRSVMKVRRIIKDFNPDVIISDFEPITNYAGLFSKCKRINFDNQNDITFRRAKVQLSEFVSFINAKMINIFWTWPAKQYFIYSIKPSRDTKNKFYFGNLIKQEIRETNIRKGNHIFVYQTSTSNNVLLETLKKIKHKFVIYGFNQDKRDKNLQFRKFNDDVYYHDFCDCKAIIANGGLTTISEAIYLKKPILSIPIEGQFEQIYNAKTIEESGFGLYTREMNVEIIKEFLNNLKKYKENLLKYEGMTNEEIFRKVDRLLDK